MKLALLFCLLAVGMTLGAANPHIYGRNVSYAGESVVRCPLPSQTPGAQDLIDELGLDVWGGSMITQTIDIRVQSYQVHSLQNVFGGRCQPFIADLEAHVRSWEVEHRAMPLSGGSWFTEYHTYTQLYQWYQDLAQKHSDLVRFLPSIGKSSQGRDMPAVVITAPGGGNNKLKLVWTAGIHAREWLAQATVNYMIDQLVQDYLAGDADVVKILQTAELHLIPFQNPDGYEFTWSGSRLWRKSRNTNPGSSCMGTDINRNQLAAKWGQGGSSRDPCSETYMGSSGSSEPESQAVERYWKSIQPGIVLGIDWHTYSQLILRPYGWSRSASPHEAQHFDLGAKMAAAIKANGGMTFQNIRSIDLYLTTGTVSDAFYTDEWNQNNGGYRALSYTFELRDTGRYGFVAPPSEIIPSGKENYAAMRTMIPQILANPLRG